MVRAARTHDVRLRQGATEWVLMAQQVLRRRRQTAIAIDVVVAVLHEKWDRWPTQSLQYRTSWSCLVPSDGWSSEEVLIPPRTERNSLDSTAQTQATENQSRPKVESQRTWTAERGCYS